MTSSILDDHEFWAGCYLFSVTGFLPVTMNIINLSEVDGLS